MLEWGIISLLWLVVGIFTYEWVAQTTALYSVFTDRHNITWEDHLMAGLLIGLWPIALGMIFLIFFSKTFSFIYNFLRKNRE